MDVQMIMIQVLVGAIVAFGISYLSIPILRKVAYLRDFYDKPDGDRKLHDRYVPTLGGVAIFLAFFVGFSISGFAEQFSGYSYFAAALTILFFTGLKDDIVDLSPWKKLLVELAAASLLIFGCGIYISSFYGVFGIYEISYPASIAVTAFTMIVVVNSYNLIDGIDGLAGGIGAIASLFFGIGFWVAGQYEFAVMALMLFVALSAYLRFNFNPAQIFMGDTGSLVVGFLLAVLAINFVGLNDVPAYVEAFGATSPIMPVAILALPLFDTITVFYRRIRKGHSPFSPGQDHIHHAIIKAGVGHKGTSILLYSCSILITLIAFSMMPYGVNAVFGVTIASMFILLPTNGFKRRMLKRMGIDLDMLFITPKTTQELRENIEQPKSSESVHYNGQKSSSKKERSEFTL